MRMNISFIYGCVGSLGVKNKNHCTDSKKKKIIYIYVPNADAYKMEEGSLLDTLDFVVINSNILSILTVLCLSEVNAPVHAAAGSCCASGSASARCNPVEDSDEMQRQRPIVNPVGDQHSILHVPLSL